jgi:hypothetical protein
MIVFHTGIYALKETRINDTIVRADCKQLGLNSGWNKRKSSLGGVRVTYLKVNFGLGLGRATWAG